MLISAKRMLKFPSWFRYGGFLYGCRLLNQQPTQSALEISAYVEHNNFPEIQAE